MPYEPSSLPSLGSVRRRMEWVSQDQRRKLRQTQINRVLELLDSDSLINLAASKPVADDVMIFECNFAPDVWNDPRIEYRVKQLAASEIVVALVEHEHTVAGKTFKRHQIHVTF